MFWSSLVSPSTAHLLFCQVYLLISFRIHAKFIVAQCLATFRYFVTLVALATWGEPCLIQRFYTASCRQWHEVTSIHQVDTCGYRQNPNILGIIREGPKSPVSIVMEFMDDVSSESSVLVHSMIILLNPLDPYMFVLSCYIQLIRVERGAGRNV